MNGGKNLLLCDAEGEKRGRLYFLPETLFLAASLPLSVYSPCMGRLNLAALRHKRDAETKIELNLWSGNAGQQPGVQHHFGGQSKMERENGKDKEYKAPSCMCTLNVCAYKSKQCTL